MVDNWIDKEFRIFPILFRTFRVECEPEPMYPIILNGLCRTVRIVQIQYVLKL